MSKRLARGVAKDDAPTRVSLSEAATATITQTTGNLSSTKERIHVAGRVQEEHCRAIHARQFGVKREAVRADKPNVSELAGKSARCRLDAAQRGPEKGDRIVSAVEVMTLQELRRIASNSISPVEGALSIITASKLPTTRLRFAVTV